MSKKLIAVAAAAALALTGLVATPANATSITNVTITSGSGASQVSAVATASHADSDSAVTANTFAAARNVLFSSSVTDAATRTAVRFEVLTAAAGAITVDATAGVKVATSISSAGVATKVDGGTTTLTGATVSGALTYTFYAWSTSTTAGSVVIKTAGSTLTFYVKGVAGEAYNIVNPTFPTSLYIGQTDGKVTFGLTDAYGNNVSATGTTPTGFGGTFSAATYSSTTKLHSAAVASVTGDNVAINLAITPVDLSANGFAKPVKSAFKLISAGDLSAQNTSLTAQVAALTASVAALTADFNALAKKYNKLVKKSKRVATK
jgi:hypothetical protein